jgi:DNA-binding transcriptional MerR regulator
MRTKPSTELTDAAALFPIGTVSEQTGVNSVTLRAWERRYGLLKPHRTPKGHRLYSEHDVERVKQVLMLLEQGIPVSRVRDVLDNRVTPPTLRLASSVETDDPWRYYRQHMVRFIHHMDSRLLEQIFNEAVSLYSLELVAKKLLQPLYHDLAQQQQWLSATTADYAFFHESLCARLSSRYLQHNSRANGKRLLLVNTQATTKHVETLFLANTLSQHGYSVSLLSHHITLDHLPLVLERTTFNALLVLGDAVNLAQLQALITLYHLPTFVSGSVIPPDAGNALHTLPSELADVSQALDLVLETAHT